MPLASDIMMVRPSAFGFNPETALTNGFQKKHAYAPAQSHFRACYEFDRFVTILRSNHIATWIIQDTHTPVKPDAVFSNNWISTHADGTIFLYPMYTANRQAERNPAVLNMLKKHFHVKKIVDLSGYATRNKPLEGTGSLVLDRENGRFYASLSARTHPDTIRVFARLSGLQPITFNARNRQGKPYYHTNIIMSIGERFALACLQSIVNRRAQREIIYALEETNKEIIEISREQTENYFSGNMLSVQNKKGEKLLVLSTQAYQHLTVVQRSKLEKHIQLLPVSIPFIEEVGGGSVRCMMTEIFLPRCRPIIS